MPNLIFSWTFDYQICPNCGLTNDMTKVGAIQCQSCRTIIYSRSRHDFHQCDCKSIFIDGGFDYLKMSWMPDFTPPTVLTLEIEATKEELYQDWNKGINKFGWIRNEQKRD